VAPFRFDRARVQSLVERLGDQLDGEWLVIGGAAAANWFSPARTTEDVDLIGLGGTQAERLALMQFAVDAGLPIEAVNSAADFFVRRVADWREHLVVLHRGARATIYRPTATLFALLKLARLSQTDLEDLVTLLAHCRTTGEQVDRERVVTALEALPVSEDHAMQQRRQSLRAALVLAAP
jgi:hypothetical protein